MFSRTCTCVHIERQDLDAPTQQQRACTLASTIQRSVVLIATHTCICTHTYIYTHVYIYIPIYTCIYMYIHVYTYIHIIYVYIMCVCIHLYIHIYVHILTYIKQTHERPNLDAPTQQHRVHALASTGQRSVVLIAACSHPAVAAAAAAGHAARCRVQGEEGPTRWRERCARQRHPSFFFHRNKTRQSLLNLTSHQMHLSMFSSVLSGCSERSFFL